LFFLLASPQVPTSGLLSGAVSTGLSTSGIPRLANASTTATASSSSSYLRTQTLLSGECS
jgi:hypothetical protein